MTVNSIFKPFSSRRPTAIANVGGSEEYSTIEGNVLFYQSMRGVFVVARIRGLPNVYRCSGSIYGFHIHEGASCSGNAEDRFADTKSHYNPKGCEHPYHAGDLPPLFSADGYAYSVTLTDRFTAEEVIGKTVVIHSAPDDFTTQPSGNAGRKIACGEITRYRRQLPFCKYNKTFSL